MCDNSLMECENCTTLSNTHDVYKANGVQDKTLTIQTFWSSLEIAKSLKKQNVILTLVMARHKAM